jgi:hypothetical protein
VAFPCCKYAINATVSQVYSYQFDSERLKQIDKCRQDIVHGDMLGDEIPQIDETRQYLFDTWMYFFLMMNETFGLRVDPSALASAGKTPEKESMH